MSLPRLTCSKDHCDPRRASCIVFCARGVDDRAEAHRIGKHRIGVTSEEGNPSAGGIGRARHDRAYPVEMESGSPMQAGGSTSSARHCSASAQRGRALADSTKRGKRAAFEDLGPVLQEQVLPKFDAGFKHANALTLSQQEGVTVSQPEPVARCRQRSRRMRRPQSPPQR